MIKTTHHKKNGGTKASKDEKRPDSLIYSKKPEKVKVVPDKKPENPDVNDADQKAESKRRIRAINPTNETW